MLLTIQYVALILTLFAPTTMCIPDVSVYSIVRGGCFYCALLMRVSLQLDYYYFVDCPCVIWAAIIFSPE